MKSADWLLFFLQSYHPIKLYFAFKYLTSISIMANMNSCHHYQCTSMQTSFANSTLCIDTCCEYFTYGGTGALEEQLFTDKLTHFDSEKIMEK